MWKTFYSYICQIKVQVNWGITDYIFFMYFRKGYSFLDMEFVDEGWGKNKIGKITSGALIKRRLV